jgi:hypothetical protein
MAQAQRKKTLARRPHRAASRTAVARHRKQWSQRMTRESDALDLDAGVFKKDSPGAIARSLKRSAEQSGRRKSEPYRSAMSMLTFYINRAGKTLSKRRLSLLERAKGELRKVFGRDKG